MRNVDNDERNAAIVTAVLQMAQQLQLRVVAEGVETEAERAFLAHHGCHEAQGWLFAPALSAAAFEQRLVDENQMASAS